ncbi:DUF4157 domain-containing protein [bacterium]|nr:DUF4157 domain-containing protein [bacterium]
MSTHADKTQEAHNRTVAHDGPESSAGSDNTFQFVDNRPEAIAQKEIQEIANTSPQVQKTAQLHEMANSPAVPPVQRQENNTGLPDTLKSGIENLSGLSMDDVSVHRNSDKPAQLHAHAYAQGTDIHLGAGQEKHLPHEAWHVVQQKQGRVKPTVQMKGDPSTQLRAGVNVNDDKGLEKEADVMGAKALQRESRLTPNMSSQINSNANDSVPLVSSVDFHDFAKTTTEESFENQNSDRPSNTGGQTKQLKIISSSNVVQRVKRIRNTTTKEIREEGDDYVLKGNEVLLRNRGENNSGGATEEDIEFFRSLARPGSAKGEQRRKDEEEARGTDKHEFREWLAYEFKGDVSELDRVISEKAKKEDHEKLILNGYLALSDGDKMDLFHKLGKLTMEGAGASIDVSQSRSWWEYLTGGGHWDWTPFALEVRKLNNSSAIKDKASTSGANIPGISSIQALNSVSAFESALGAITEQLNKEAIKKAMRDQAIGPENDNFQTFATITRNVKLLALVALRITSVQGRSATQFASMLPGLGFLIAVAEAGSMVQQITLLNSRIDTLKELQNNAKEIPPEIYTRAIQNAKLERGTIAAKSASIALSIAGTAAALALTGPASLGVGLGLAALALAVGGIVKLVGYFQNVSNQKIAARSLLARIHGIQPGLITESNEGQYLQEIGYAGADLIKFWDEYLTSYSEELYRLVNDGNQEAIELLKTIEVDMKSRRFSAKTIKDKL